MARKQHVVLVPYPFQGTLNPFVHLAMHLANNGFIVTFINTEFVHHKLTKAHPNRTNIFAPALNHNIDIRYLTVSDGFPTNFQRHIDNTLFWEGMLNVFAVHVDKVIGNLVASDPDISCLIADTYYVWSSSIARKYKLLNISFWTQPAIAFSLYYHLNLLEDNAHCAPQSDELQDAIDYIPGIDSISPKDVPPFLKKTNEEDVLRRIVSEAFDNVRRADFVLCNTVEEFEESTLAALQLKQRIIPIGPMFPIGPTRDILFSSLQREVDLRSWLDKRRPGSVIYISFGSIVPCSLETIQVIADGLALSKMYFIWVIHRENLSYEQALSLHAGFNEKTRNRCRVVPWCNQMEVLSNRAVCGFMSNCGWNSILEAIQFGVPLLCFPLMFDQFTTRKLVVEDLKIGLNLFDVEEKNKVEVAKKVKLLTSGSGASELRKNMRELKRTMEVATQSGGSSANYMKSCLDYIKYFNYNKRG